MAEARGSPASSGVPLRRIFFCLQGRGYPYHRYPSEVFLLLLSGIACTEALEQPISLPVRPAVVRWIVKGLACAGLAFGALVVAPRSLLAILHIDGRRNSFQQSLGTDLTRFGVPTLRGRVQCLDMAGGCIATLYHLRLKQSSGFLYDCYLYPMNNSTPSQTADRERYRRAFQEATLRNPPIMFIATSDECGPRDDQYTKLKRWPWLASYLRDHYTLEQEWLPSKRSSGAVIPRCLTAIVFTF